MSSTFAPLASEMRGMGAQEPLVIMSTGVSWRLLTRRERSSLAVAAEDSIDEWQVLASNALKRVLQVRALQTRYAPPVKAHVMASACRVDACCHCACCEMAFEY